jgi:hypothetical protein
MYAGMTLFTQVMDFLPWTLLTCIVPRYRGDYCVRTPMIARVDGIS